MKTSSQKVLSLGEDLGEVVVTLAIKVCGMRNVENIQAVAALPIDYMGFIFYEKSPRYVTHPNVDNVQSTDNIKKVGVFVNEKIEIIVQKIIEYQLDAVQLHGNETNDFINELRRGVPLRSPNATLDDIQSPNVMLDDIQSPNVMLDDIQSPNVTLDDIQSPNISHEKREFENVELGNRKGLPLQIIKSISISEKNDFEKINDYPDADFLLLDTKTPQHGGSGQKFDWTLLDGVIFPKPFFLSGGIALEDVEVIKALKINNLYGLDLNSKFEIEPALKDVGKLERFIRAVKNV
jgi:phosphoribosylanthranilate isomerase